MSRDRRREYANAAFGVLTLIGVTVLALSVVVLANESKGHTDQAASSAHVAHVERVQAQQAATNATESVTDLQAVRRLALDRDAVIEREVIANRVTIKTLEKRLRRLEARRR